MDMLEIMKKQQKYCSDHRDMPNELQIKAKIFVGSTIRVDLMSQKRELKFFKIFLELVIHLHLLSHLLDVTTDLIYILMDLQ